MNSTLIDYNNWEQVIEGNYYDLFTLNDKDSDECGFEIFHRAPLEKKNF